MLIFPSLAILPIRSMKILVVGSSPLPRGLSGALRSQYEIDVSNLDKRLFFKIANNNYSLILIWSQDISFLKLKKILEFLYRRFSSLNILVCGSTYHSPQRASILLTGVKDCIAGGVEAEELLAKIQIITQPTNGFKRKQFKKQHFSFDFNQNIASYRGVFIPLNKKEASILHCLLNQVDNIVLRKTLYNSAWNSPTLPNSNSLDVHISSIRRKIEKPHNIHLIESVKGMGYRVKSD